MKLSPRNQLLLGIRRKAILRGDEQRLISQSGRPYTWLLDLRRILTDARLLDAAAELFWDVMKDCGPFQVGGMEVAAIPLLSAILLKSVAHGRPINGFIVRKERKTYGTGALIEGELTDEPIVIVDDVINSAKSLDKVRAVLFSYGRTIESVFALVDYQSPRGLRWREAHSVAVSAPFSLADFGLSLNRNREPAIPDIFEVVWRFAPPDPNFFHRVPKSFPVVDAHRLYVGSDCGTFWALNARDGKVEWTFKVSSPGHKNIWSSPALHEDRVFFGAYDGNLYCLNCASGQEIWRFEGADWIGSSPALAPALNLVFVGLEFAVEGRRGSIAAVDLRTGEKVWEHLTKRYTHASPAYWPERGVVCCGSNDNEVLMFEATTGRLLWRFETRGERGKGSVRHAVAFDKERGAVIVACADGVIYIVDATSGCELWSVETDNTLYTIPLVVKDLAFVGSTDKHLYILDLGRATLLRKINLGSKVFSPPRLIGRSVYVGDCAGRIHQFDPERGLETGYHQLPDSITGAMTCSPDGETYYATTYVNEVFALRLRCGSSGREHASEARREIQIGTSNLHIYAA